MEVREVNENSRKAGADRIRPALQRSTRRRCGAPWAWGRDFPVFEGKTADRALPPGRYLADLTGGQDEADRIAKGVDGDADPRAQAAMQASDRLIFAPPWGTGCMLLAGPHNGESMIRYSRSGCSPSSVKGRCRLPFFAHCRNLLRHKL